MAKRTENEYWLTLTYDDKKFNVSGLDAKEYKRISDRQLRNFLVSLRDKARRERWQYMIVVCPSIQDRVTGKAKRLHTHVYIKANPASTICKYIDQYWGKRYGLVEYGTISGGVQGTGNYLAYMKDQALFTKSQSEGFLESCHPQETVISSTSEGLSHCKVLNTIYTIYNTIDTMFKKHIRDRFEEQDILRHIPPFGVPYKSFLRGGYPPMRVFPPPLLSGG